MFLQACVPARPRAFLFAATLAVASSLAMLPVQQAHAGIYSFTVVSSSDSPGSCNLQTNKCTTLRAAIDFANGLAGTNMVTVTLRAGTFSLKRGELAITSPGLTLNINGAGPGRPEEEDLQDATDSASLGDVADTNALHAKHGGEDRERADGTIVQRSESAAQGRVFDICAPNSATHVCISTGPTVNLSGIAIRNGRLSNDDGAGIRNGGGGTLTLTRVSVSGNSIRVTSGTPSVPNNGFGAGISSGNGSLTLTNVRIAHNSLTVGIYGAGGGAGISSRGPLTIKASTIANNKLIACPDGNLCAEQAAGVAARFGPTVITNSTISGNVGANAEGGLDNGLGPITIVNSTIAGNSAPGPAGIVGGFLTFGGPAALANITNTTISGNTGTLLGGIVANGPVIRLQSTIVANNSTVVGEKRTDGNCNRPVASGGYNLDSGNTCGLTGPGDLISTDPRLGRLRNNGGPTQTQALLPGSPAIDAVASSVCPPPSTDQRGAPRPQGRACDIGAFEVALNSVGLTANPSSIPASGTHTARVTATVTNVGIAVGGDTVTFSSSGTCGSLTPTSGSTRPNGAVSVTYLSSTTVGFCTITATEAATGSHASATIIQTANPVPSGITTVLTANPVGVPADGTSTSTLSATVRSRSGAFLSGDPVRFTTGGGASCGNVKPSSGTTNAAGQVSVTYVASVTVGSCTITVTEALSGRGGSTVITQFPVPNTVVVVASPSALPANGTATSTVTVTVRTGGPPVFGAAVSGDVVTFALNGSPLAACGALSAATATTNVNGQATVTYTSSLTPGFCTLTATEATTNASGSTTIAQTAPLHTVAVTANPSTVNTTAPGNTSAITVTVRDATGAAVSGDAVTFMLTGNPAAACGALSNISGTPASTTNSGGQVTATYTASAAPGFCTVKATETNGGNASATIVQRTPRTAAATISLSASPSSIKAAIGKTSTLTATVQKADGTGLAADQVLFTSSGSPTAACGTIDTISGTPAGTTDANGVVTATYHATTTVGTCTVTVQEANAGLSTNATVTQTVAANSVAETFNGTCAAGSAANTPGACIKADGASTLKATANVRNPSGNPVAGDVVTFTAAANTAGVCSSSSLSGSAATTDTNGNASVTYTASTTSGYCSITASEGTTSGSDTESIDQTLNTATLPANVVAVTTNLAACGTGGVNPNCIAADGSSTATMTVKVTNAGANVSGDPIMLSTSGTPSAACGGLSGTGFASTDTNGVVTVTYTASRTAGSCVITAQEANGAHNGSATITQTPSNNVAVAANPASLKADGTSTSAITVTVTDSTGAAVSGDAVTFTLTPNAPGSCGTLGSVSGSPTGTTNSSGSVTATYTASNSSGFCTITVVEGATGGRGSVTIVQTASGAPAVVSVTANPSSVPADGFSTSTITATVTTASGAPVFGDAVRFSAAGAACGSLRLTTATTNGSGKASTTYTASISAGTCAITATEANAGFSGRVVITQTAFNVVLVTLSSTRIPADGTSTVTVTANVVTGSGAAVSGDAVTFTATAFPAGACGSLSALSATTDLSGIARVTYTATTTSGFCSITATEANTNSSDTENLVQKINAPIAANTINVTVNPPTTIKADGTSTTTVTANVKTPTGIAVAGDPVLFTKRESVAGACGTLSSKFGSTDASGNFTTIYTSSTTAGRCAINGQEANTGAATANTVGVTQTLTVAVMATPSSISADGVSTSTITATVTDSSGAAVAGDAVIFSFSSNPAGVCGTLNGISGSPPGTTDANGKVTATYTASTTIGFCTITATDASGGNGSVTIIQHT